MNQQYHKLIAVKVCAAFVAAVAFMRVFRSSSSTAVSSVSSQVLNLAGLHRSLAVRFIMLAVAIWSALAPTLLLAQSPTGIVPTTNPNYRPTVLLGNNGTPIVNIRSINEYGVSRNQFTQFDIGEAGVVLNNARFGTSSQLAGDIEGNFWLLNGEATTIVNEVLSNNPTRLNGKIEVAGRAANVIIANPNGLSINGGSLINANHSVLAAGSIQYNQGLPKSIQAGSGTIDINNQGLAYQYSNQNNPYFAQLFAKTITAQASISNNGTQYLQLIAGDNQADLNALGLIGQVSNLNNNPSAIDQAKPVAIDIGALGQIYAHGIYLVSTDKGAGVNQAGTLKANRHISLSADGKITQAGQIAGTDAESAIYLHSQNDAIDNTGSVDAKAKIDFDAKAGVRFDALDYQGSADLTINAGGDVKSQKPININTTGKVAIAALGDFTADNAQITSQTHAINLSAGNLSITNSRLDADDNINLTGKDIRLSNNTIQADSLLIGGDGIQSSNNRLDTKGDTALIADSALDLNQDAITSNKLAIVSTADTVQFDQLSANAKDSIAVQAGDNLTIKNSTLSGRNLSLHSKNNAQINQTTLDASDHLAIGSQDGELSLDDGNITANGLISVRADGNVLLNQSTINAGSLSIISQKAAVDWQDATLSTKKHDILANNPALQAANGAMIIKSHDDMTVRAGKNITTAGDLELASNGMLTLQGQAGEQGRGSQQQVNINAGGNVYLQGSGVELQGTQVTAAKNTTVIATQGNLNLSVISSPISGIKDAVRIDELNAQIADINQQITTLNNDTLYQTALSDHKQANDELIKLQKEHAQSPIGDYDKQKQALQQKQASSQQRAIFRRQELGIDDDADELTRQLGTLKQSLKIANMEFVGSQNTGTSIDTAGDINLISAGGISVQMADLQSRTGSVNLTAIGNQNQARQFVDENTKAKLLALLRPDAIGADDNVSRANQLIDGLTFDADDLADAQKINEHKNALKQAYLDAKDGNDKKINDFKQLLNAAAPITQLPIAISIEGVYDIYQRGNFDDDSYAVSKNYQPSRITAKDTISINAVSQSDGDDTKTKSAVLLIGGNYQAKDINITSTGSTILQAGQDLVYDRHTSVSKRGKIKKKTTVTTTTEQMSDAESVALNANNIRIQTADSLFAYASRFNAPAGNIELGAGDALRLFAVQQVDEKNIDSQTTSKFLGVKYRKSRLQSYQQILTELPTFLVADYTQSQSGDDTYLQGTVFGNLSGADIYAGVGENANKDAKIILDTASTTISQRQVKEYNNKVWQSIEDKGSITQTADLPSFTGVSPNLNATGGLLVQVPINKDDPASQEHLVATLQNLSQKPGFEYLNDIITRDDIDFTALRLAQEQWNYKQEGLTPEAAGVIAIAVTIATNGAGATLLGTTGAVSSAMANAAFSSLASKAYISLINNKGDINKTFKDLGKSATVKDMARAAVTAGITKGLDGLIGKYTSINITDTADWSDRFARGFIQGTGGALADSLLYGTSLEDNLKRQLTNQLIDAAASGIYSDIIKPLDANDTGIINNSIHKISAGLTGCVAAKAKGEACKAGALGAMIGEMVGDWMTNRYPAVMIDGKTVYILSDQDKQKIINTAKLLSASAALLYEFDVNTASASAEEAVRWNATYIDKNNEVKKVILNGDKGIYKCNFQNNKCIDNPIKIGESMFEDAFISPDTGLAVGKVFIGESVDAYIYKLNAEAENDTKITVAWKSIPYQKYIPGMGNYDIKKSYGNGEIKTYHGYLFHGKYITLREGGNILAGMNAATLGIPYDEFQKASGALHAGGITGLIKHNTTGYTYGTYPRYGEIDYQYLRSKYGYDFKINAIKMNQEAQLIRNSINFNNLSK
ncbi:two-partner secretion domain-containing protein [Moraxella cuniculi]|uniref:Filamentous hemagglutinin n=1 Tax=Moraxella cuniculi TaxID=34061 RepID=A0A448GUJ1_9GAMM|nr:DUF637 domain-containing protein [Moraxella cuniculi]VEG12417.1 Filamentous hemagglutinin [Moraxella cuniculi]